MVWTQDVFNVKRVIAWKGVLIYAFFPGSICQGEQGLPKLHTFLLLAFVPLQLLEVRKGSICEMVKNPT